jgi:hypothetical protein
LFLFAILSSAGPERLVVAVTSGRARGGEAGAASVVDGLVVGAAFVAGAAGVSAVFLSVGVRGVSAFGPDGFSAGWDDGEAGFAAAAGSAFRAGG